MSYPLRGGGSRHRRRDQPSVKAVVIGLTVVAAVTFLPKVGERDAQAQGAGGDAAAGKAEATLCAACHGPVGVSVNPAWPSLAGQQPVYLAKQIRMFRDGERLEPTMQPFVQNLTDQDIDDLAAYYASLSPCP